MKVAHDNPAHRTIEKGPAIGFGLALALLVAVSVVSFLNMHRLLSCNKQVIRTHEVLRQIDDLSSTLREAESGQRGYLLTGEEDYLEPCDKATAVLERQLAELRELTQNNPNQKRRFQTLEPLVADERAELQETIALRRQGKQAAAVQIVRGGQGKRGMDDIRRLTGEMVAEEEELLLRQSAEVDANARHTNIIIVLADAFAVILVAAAMVLVLRNGDRCRQAEDALRQAHASLESRVRERTLELAGANELLRGKEARLRILVEQVPALLWTTDLHLRFSTSLGAGLAALHLQPGDLDGRSLAELQPHDPDWPLLAAHRRVLRGELVNFEVNYLGRILNGYVEPLLNADGARVGCIGVALDVTERRQAERATYQLAALVESSDDAILGIATDATIASWNQGAQRLFGYTTAEVQGRPVALLVPADRTGELARVLESFPRGEHVEPFDTIGLRKDGKPVDVSIRVSPVQDRTGRVVGAAAILRDITRHKRLEEQLRQAQKMEAVGRLAGGVAHDFNNLLTVILGYSDFLLVGLGPDQRARGLVEEIRKAGDRASALTRQLLAFSRKQVVNPRVLDLNQVLAGMDTLLHRLIGEDIQLTEHLDAGLGRVKADPGRIEQIVMNLAVNARDAMPDGGRLTIETTNVVLDENYIRFHMDLHPGPHVLLAVSDTGTGMSAEVQAHLFEPFFTTKEQGKGTGLGLSTVYGIVKNSNGHIDVYSELGHGTTFKVYLPRIEEAVTPETAAPAPRPRPRASETVLLVEDEAAIREMIRLALLQEGYAVLTAGGGSDALRLSAAHDGPIQLLITDVVMPEISGPQLAEQLRSPYPELKVLYMSGYSGSIILDRGVFEEGNAFLQKPFTPDALAQKVRDVLDQGTSQP